MKLIRSILLACGCAVSLSAQAGLITDYSLDETTNIVTDSRNNLEWLQWDVTRGMSINSALSVYTAEGWQLATNAQMAELFNAFDLSYGEFTWDDDENTIQYHSHDSDGPVEAVDDREKLFVGLFGNTWLELTDTISDYEYSSALFGTDMDNDGLYNDARVYDDYRKNNGDYFRNFSQMDNDFGFTRNSEPYRKGVALVRSDATIDVPEPSSIALFAMVLTGLSARRFRKV